MALPVKLAGKLLGSSVLAQVAVLVATGVAARGLVPHDLALYGAASGASSVVASVNTLAAETRATVLDERGAGALLRAGATSVLAVALACAALGGVGLGLGHEWGTILLLTAGCGAMLGAQQLLTAVVLRQQHQHLLARGRLVQGLSNAALILAFLLTPLTGYLILTLAWLISLAAGCAILWFGSHARPSGWARREDWTRLRAEVGQQPLANLLAGSVASMPLILLPALGQHLVSGAWALVSRILTPMVNTTYNTLQPLYYGRAAEFVRDRDDAGLAAYYGTWVRRLTLLGAVATVGCFFATWFGLPLLGPQWRVTPAIALAGAVYFGTLFVCLPLSQTLLLLGRVRTTVWWTVVRFFCCLLPFVLLPLIGGTAALLAWAGASALTFGWQLLLNRSSLVHHRDLISGPTAQEA